MKSPHLAAAKMATAEFDPPEVREVVAGLLFANEWSEPWAAVRSHRREAYLGHADRAITAHTAALHAAGYTITRRAEPALDAGTAAEVERLTKQCREITAALEIASNLPGSNRCQAFVRAFVEERDWAVADVAKHLAAQERSDGR